MPGGHPRGAVSSICWVSRSSCAGRPMIGIGAALGVRSAIRGSGVGCVDQQGAEQADAADEARA